MKFLEFGPALRTIRHQRGLSQKALAKSAGVTNTTLSFWETGRVEPRLPELHKVLKALDINAAEQRTLLQLLEGSRTTRGLDRMKGDAAPSVGGDLLWSMRLRKGWTQAEAARAVGVHQAQITRWERSEAWPDAQKLHALCWHLSARPEEVAALTLGVPKANCSATLAAMPEVGGLTARRLDVDQWNRYLHSLLFYNPPEALLDLTMLTIESRLGALTEQDAASALLPSFYAAHARHHMNNKRLRLATHFAERGLAIMRRERQFGKMHFASLGHSHWFGNIIAVAAGAASNHSLAGQNYAVHIMREWLPVLSNKADGYRAWGLSTVASVLGRMDRLEEAVAVSHQACAPEFSPKGVDLFLRRLDQARLFIDMKRHRQALGALERCLEIESFVPVRFLAQRNHLHADCLRELGDQVTAGSVGKAA